VLCVRSEASSLPMFLLPEGQGYICGRFPGGISSQGLKIADDLFDKRRSANPIRTKSSSGDDFVPV
jgi:hypothetical protein